jgi:putative transposase
LLQRRRNGRAAKRFFRKLLKRQQRSPNRLVTDKLGSYRVAHREEMAGVPHDTTQYANNRIEASHRRTRIRERQMLGFRSGGSAQRFLSVQFAVLNLFNWSRHSLRAEQYRFLRSKRYMRGRWQVTVERRPTSGKLSARIVDVTEPRGHIRSSRRGMHEELKQLLNWDTDA